jgi:hypothetical protein
VLEGHSRREHPIVLSEFGGLALRSTDGTWGYTSADDLASFERIFGQLLKVVRRLEALSGFCYTQLTDTYQEANGLLYADRRPKLPIATIFQTVAGVELGPLGPPPIVVDAQDEPEP